MTLKNKIKMSKHGTQENHTVHIFTPNTTFLTKAVEHTEPHGSLCQLDG